jgi:hypothetical protein
MKPVPHRFDTLLLCGSEGFFLGEVVYALIARAYWQQPNPVGESLISPEFLSDFWTVVTFTLFGIWFAIAAFWVRFARIHLCQGPLLRCSSLIQGTCGSPSAPKDQPLADRCVISNSSVTQPTTLEAHDRLDSLKATGGQVQVSEPVSHKSTTGIPRVAITKSLLTAIHDYICDFVMRRGTNLEIGGMLVGAFEPAHDAKTITVRLNGYIDAGPNSDCKPGSILMDSDYQSNMLKGIQLREPRADVGGMFHLHPGAYDECSTGDFEADCRAVAAAGTGFLVFVIITRNNPKEDPLSLRLGDLKFDFFVMSQVLGRCYHKVMPVIEGGTLLQPEPLLARWIRIKGSQASLDFALLRQVHGLGSISLCEVAIGKHAGLWLTILSLQPRRAIHILLSQDGALRLFLGNEQAPEHECMGPWTQPEIGRLILISQLVLLALEHVGANRAALVMGRHSAPLIKDKQRLVAEVRAMRERFRDEPQLLHDGVQLLWRCTVCQNGREFPVEILYPETYPHDPPEIRCLVNLKTGCPHLLHNCTLCWIDFYGNHSEWNPGRDTAATALIAAGRWFACYLVWLTTGKWPEGTK